MFVGDEIGALIDLFNKRDVSLFHSCQLQDFQSYLRLGGIPSRQLLSDCGLPFTEFETDCLDRENGVWDKAFLNLQDFGAIFANGKMGVPTVYGPITFAMSPEVLGTAADVAICLRSAGISGFQRDNESLQTIEDVDRLFYYNIDCYTRNRASLKSRSALRKIFCVKSDCYISYPEISCTVSEGKLSLSFTQFLLIDTYHFGSKSLKEIVEDYLSANHTTYKVIERCPRQARRKLYDEIVMIARKKKISALADFLSEDLSPDLFNYLKQIQKNPDHETQWRRYTKYLLKGTLEKL